MPSRCLRGAEVRAMFRAHVVGQLESTLSDCVDQVRSRGADGPCASLCSSAQGSSWLSCRCCSAHSPQELAGTKHMLRPIIPCSSRTRAGIDLLRAQLAALVPNTQLARPVPYTPDAKATRPEHLEAALRPREHGRPGARLKPQNKHRGSHGRSTASL